MNIDSLRFTIGNIRDLNCEAREKRIANILAFANLDKAGLAFRQTERMLRLHTTSAGEAIFIQYPGKETITGTPEKMRPWDFRPKMFDCRGQQIKDLSFADIWDDLCTIHTENAQSLEILAALFFRMAYLLDYRLTTDIYQFHDHDLVHNGIVTRRGTIAFKWFKPCFPLEILTEVQAGIGLIRGFSWEAYLFYNDLLIQNEDCKYYYRDTWVKNKKWDSKSGRQNTMFSHLSVIEYLQGRITFSQIMYRFQRGMGVALALMRDVPQITGDIITQA